MEMEVSVWGEEIWLKAIRLAPMQYSGCALFSALGNHAFSLERQVLHPKWRTCTSMKGSQRKVMPVTVNSSDGQENEAFDHRMR